MPVIGYSPSEPSLSDLFNSTITTPALQGWTSGPNGRGTLDIIYSCLSTIVLCSWSVLCLNIPAAGDSYWKQIQRKFYLACLGVAGPEFTLQLSLTQWTSARRSVKAFRELGYSEWSMGHAFYADMGGFLLKTPDFEPFPVTGRQLHYLVAKGYVAFPEEVTKEVIAEQNREEVFVRAITVGQTLWFTMNTISRAVQKLEITTLELTAMSFVFCTLVTFFCWAHKPSNAQRAVTICIEVSIDQILSESGISNKNSYEETPLEFIAREEVEWSWMWYWSFWTNTLRKMGLHFAPRVRPYNRVPNDTFPAITGREMCVMFIFQSSYAAIFLSSWNFQFPTAIEHRLWRIAICSTLGIIICVWLIDGTIFHLLPSIKRQMLKSKSKRKVSRSKSEPGSSPTMLVNRQKTSTLKHDSFETTPANAPLLTSTAVGLVTAFGAAYCFVRGYVLAQDLASLRAMPPSAYDTVDWSKFLPHL